MVAKMDDRPLDMPRQAGIYVRQAREANGLTQGQLAKMAGVSKRTLVSLELGDSTGIQLDKLLAVLNAAGLGLAVVEKGVPHSVAAAKPKKRLVDGPVDYDALLADFLQSTGIAPDQDQHGEA